MKTRSNLTRTSSRLSRTKRTSLRASDLAALLTLAAYCIIAVSIWYRDFLVVPEEFYNLDLRYPLAALMSGYDPFSQLPANYTHLSDINLVPVHLVAYGLGLDPLQAYRIEVGTRMLLVLLSAYSFLRVQRIGAGMATCGVLIAGSTLAFVRAYEYSSFSWQSISMTLSFVLMVKMSRTGGWKWIVISAMVLPISWLPVWSNATTAVAGLAILPIAYFYITRSGVPYARLPSAMGAVTASFLLTYLLTLNLQRYYLLFLPQASQILAGKGHSGSLTLMMQPGRGWWAEGAGADGFGLYIPVSAALDHPVVEISRFATFIVPVVAAVCLAFCRRAKGSSHSALASDSQRALIVYMLASLSLFVLAAGQSLIPFYESTRDWGVLALSVWREPWTKFILLFVLCVSAALCHALQAFPDASSQVRKWTRVSLALVTIVLAWTPLVRNLAFPNSEPYSSARIVSAAELVEFQAWANSLSATSAVCLDPESFSTYQGQKYSRVAATFLRRPLYSNFLYPEYPTRVSSCAEVEYRVPMGTKIVYVSLGRQGTRREGETCPSAFTCEEVLAGRFAGSS